MATVDEGRLYAARPAGGGYALKVSYCLADPAFRADQPARLREAILVRPINDLIEPVRGVSRAPAAMKTIRTGCLTPSRCVEGVQARKLCIRRNPGDRTLDSSGSGFLWAENVGPTSRRPCLLFRHVRVSPADNTRPKVKPSRCDTKSTSARRRAARNRRRNGQI